MLCRIYFSFSIWEMKQKMFLYRKCEPLFLHFYRDAVHFCTVLAQAPNLVT